MADLITLDEYKEQEGITSPKEDVRLSHIITSVSQLVKTYCGNSIIDHYSNYKVETMNVRWATVAIQLTESPLVNVTEVKERDSVSSQYSILVANTDYFVDTTTDSLIRISGGVERPWKIGPGSVLVTYNAGYEECPADLRLAVYDLVTYYLKDEHKERRSLQGATVQNQSSTTQKNNVAFPDHIKRVLDLYKNF
jgi:hypothetical protein